MKTIIQMSEAEEAKALPLLLRHSPGTVLPNRIYVVSEEAAKKLREAGVQFTELSRDATVLPLEGV
ncbi:MAG TPA: hypothetical protein VIH59_01795, partial [Candidatus Tectomicrobia bacterium]